MKLLYFALFSFTALGAGQVQHKPDGEWSQLDRDIAAVSAKASSLVIYDVRDLAASLGEDYDEPDWNAPAETDKRGERTVHLAPESFEVDAHGKHARGGDHPLRISTRASDEPQDPAVREAHILTGTTRLAEVIHDNIEPALQENLHTITVAGAGSLAIVATLAQHEWIKRVLALARQTTDMPKFETRWLVGAHGSFEKLGLKAGSNLPTAEQFRTLLARTEGDDAATSGFERINASTLMLHNLARASIRTSNAIDYVKDWDVRRALPGPKDYVVPVLATLEPGNVFQVRAVLIEPNLYRCALRVEHSSVKQPIRVTKVPLGAAPGGEVEIALPELDIQRVSSDTKLASGAAVAFVIALDDQKDLALLVQLSTVAKQAPPADEHK
jgi:hypothetical protein